MNDDIVIRLRMQDADYALQEEAADEIERLRAENARLSLDLMTALCEAAEMYADRNNDKEARRG